MGIGVYQVFFHEKLNSGNRGIVKVGKDLQECGVQPRGSHALGVILSFFGRVGLCVGSAAPTRRGCRCVPVCVAGGAGLGETLTPPGPAQGLEGLTLPGALGPAPARGRDGRTMSALGPSSQNRQDVPAVVPQCHSHSPHL